MCLECDRREGAERLCVERGRLEGGEDDVREVGKEEEEEQGDQGEGREVERRRRRRRARVPAAAQVLPGQLRRLRQAVLERETVPSRHWRREEGG